MSRVSNSLALCVVLLLTGSCLANAGTEPTEGAELEMLVGSWVVEEELFFVPGKIMQGSGVMNGSWGPGKHSVLVEYRSVEGPMVGFELEEIFAREHDENSYRLVWVDSMSPGIKSKTGTYGEEGFRFVPEAGEQNDSDTVSTIRSTGGTTIISTYKIDNGEPGDLVMRLTCVREESR